MPQLFPSLPQLPLSVYPSLSLDQSAVLFSSIQFPSETARHKRVSLLLYFIIFIFSYPQLRNMFHFFFTELLFCCVYTILYRRVHADAEGCHRLILLLRFISLETNCSAHSWTHFLCELQRTFWPLKCPSSSCVCVCVFVVCLSVSTLIRSSSAYATNFSFRLRCVLS